MTSEIEYKYKQILKKKSFKYHSWKFKVIHKQYDYI